MKVSHFIHQVCILEHLHAHGTAQPLICYHLNRIMKYYSSNENDASLIEKEALTTCNR